MAVFETSRHDFSIMVARSKGTFSSIPVHARLAFAVLHQEVQRVDNLAKTFSHGIC